MSDSGEIKFSPLAYKKLFGTHFDEWQPVETVPLFGDDCDEVQRDDGEFAQMRDSFKSGRPARNPHLSLQASSAVRRDFSTHQIAYRRKELQQVRDQSSYAPKSAERLRMLKMVSPSCGCKLSPNKKSTSRHRKRASALGDFTLA